MRTDFHSILAVSFLDENEKYLISKGLHVIIGSLIEYFAFHVPLPNHFHLNKLDHLTFQMSLSKAMLRIWSWKILRSQIPFPSLLLLLLISFKQKEICYFQIKLKF